MAARLCCRCAATLADVGEGRRCPRCQAPAEAWLVASEGAIVAIADEGAMLPGDELRAGMRYAARGAWSGAE